jgi:uncharacterized protein
MLDITAIIIVFLTGLFATFLSSMSGGGASVITIPVFLSIGLPYAMAMAIQKVCSTFWVIPAASNYLSNRKIDWRFLITYVILGIIGAYIGIQVLLITPDKTMKTIVGILILILVIYTYFDKNLGIKSKIESSKAMRFLSTATAVPLGFYESIFGSGNGIIFSVIGCKMRGFDMKEALGYYFAAAFFWVLLASGLLIYKGYFDIPLMTAAAIGSIIGGYYGSKLGNYKGNAFIKGMFIIIGLILGFKLLLNI